LHLAGEVNHVQATGGGDGYFAFGHRHACRFVVYRCNSQLPYWSRQAVV
jgi:hypothetical protein